MKRRYLFDLEHKYEVELKINFKILNRNSYLLFNILVVNIEIFSKRFFKDITHRHCRLILFSAAIKHLKPKNVTP